MKRITAALASIALLAAPQARAVGHKTGQFSTDVDGQPYRVNTYDDGSVKVIERGMFGDAPSFNLRNRMRQAVRQATACEVADDFWLDAKLVGRLSCSDAGSIAPH